MSIRVICWTMAMAYAGFLIVGKGAMAPLGVTTSGALLGGGFGLILALMFSRRSKRKNQLSVHTLRRY